MRRNLLFAPLLLAAGVALAEDASKAEPAAAATAQDPKLLDGMSILGNQEAPKSLVIVPWKSSELGDALGISPSLDDSRQPVDRDVFVRALGYYQIRSETTRHDGAQPATAARRSKS